MSTKTGRYDAIAEAAHPGAELPSLRLAGRVETVVAAVADPNPVFGEKLQRQRVAVNIARDPLEQEYRRGRITTPAYLAGRTYQRVMEAAHIGGGSCSNFERSGGAGDHESTIARQTDRVAAAVRLDGLARRQLGAWAAMLLRGVLCDGHSLRQIAERNGRATKAAQAQVVAEFREALEDLAEELERRGMVDG